MIQVYRIIINYMLKSLKVNIIQGIIEKSALEGAIH